MRLFNIRGVPLGPRLTAIIEGVPAGASLYLKDDNKSSNVVKGGYGHWYRMKIE